MGSQVGAINRRYLGSKPEGYLLPSDYAQAERLKGRAAQSAGFFGQDATGAIKRRAAARGIAGSPSVERDIGRVKGQEGQIIESAGQQAESNLYNTRLGRENFQQNQIMTAWGADLQNEYMRQQREYARESQFWNSFNTFLPFIGDFATGGLAGAAGGGGLPVESLFGAYTGYQDTPPQRRG